MIILSGGANGSDMLFGSLGYVTYVFSFVGHKPCYPLNGKVIIIPNWELVKREEELNVVIKRLGRGTTKNDFAKKLLLRNMYQVVNKKYRSQLVVAIGTIVNGKTVDGGTGYAVEKAKLESIPVVVLNKSDNKFYWYSPKKDMFVLLPRPISLAYVNVLTGIGSREITSTQENIIRECFTKETIFNS